MKAMVLVVDDEAPVRLLLARLLQRQGHLVAEAPDGDRAWELLQTESFDLVLLDIVMPNRSGTQLLAQMKADTTIAQIPVLMVSALEDTDAIARCLELGAEDYLFKPPNAVLLKARVEACLARKQMRDRDQADLRQLQAEKANAEALSRAKSQFLANMSHELRTPLNAIIGYSEMLQEDLLAAGQAKFLTDLAKIHQAGTHLLALISDILDLSKIDAGKMPIDNQPIDVAALVTEITQSMHATLTANQNDLAIDCPQSIGLIESDPDKIKQILCNLLANAAKFTHNGTITLSVNTIEVEEPLNQPPTASASPTPQICFQVADTGIGIAPDQQEQIFRVFTQGDESSTRQYGGTGLGLAISQRLSQLLGGSLSVESEVDRGSTFTLLLPAVQPAAYLISSAHPASPH